MAVRTAIGIVAGPAARQRPWHAAAPRPGGATGLRARASRLPAVRRGARRRALEHPHLAGELHHAIRHSGLGAEYCGLQPQRADLPPRLRLASYWPHPHRGRLEERELLAIPDRRSLAHALTLWLLGEGLVRLAAWRAGFEPRLALSLRLPDAALRYLPLGELVGRLLTAHDLPAAALALEFGESGLVGGGGHARSQLAALRGAGIGVCLAGVGYPGAAVTTPLYHPVNELCLSPLLLQRAARDATAEQAMLHVMAAGRALGQRLILTGVDTGDLRALAMRLGGDYAEGLAYGLRLEPDAVAALLATPSAA